VEITISVLAPESLPTSRLPDADALARGDRFLVARRTGPYDDGFRLAYEQLSARVAADVKAALALGSMAYREEYQYARVNHSHPYHKVRAVPCLSFEDVVAQYPESQRASLRPRQIDEYMGTATVYDRADDGSYAPFEYDFYSNRYNEHGYQQPVVGELRMFACDLTASYSRSVAPADRAENKMYYDEANDGFWAVPAGQTIEVAPGEFRDACMLYGATKSAADTSMTMPKLDYFVKLSPSSDGKTALARAEWQNGLPAHSDHKVDNSSFSSGKITLEADMTIKTTKLAQGRGGKVHSGGNAKISGPTRQLSAEVSMQEIKSQDGNTGVSPESLDVETRPNHVKLPALVYLGRK